MGNKVQLVGILLAPGIVLLVVLGNMLVLEAYLSDPQVVLRLANTPANFPIGLISALFTPDTTVLLGTQSIYDWYIGTAGSMLTFLFLLILVSADMDSRNLAVRSGFYGPMLIVISVLSNAFALVRGVQSIGPSTAVMAGIGLVLGFSLANSWQWVRKGHPRFARGKMAVAVFTSLTLSLALPFAAVVIPTAFFYIAPGVDWVAHVFCFLVGASSAVVFTQWLRFTPYVRRPA